MRKSFVTPSLLFLCVGGFLAARATGDETEPEPAKILKFNTMVGVPRGFTGGAEPIRGVPGGGLPWVVESAVGELREDGEVRVHVKGLVFDPNDPVVIQRGLGGINPIPAFKAIVSCLTLDENGEQKIVNHETQLFAADLAGDCFIKDTVELPEPCIAPIVFVTSPGGAWFATTGS